MNITFNGNDYNVARISLLAKEGIRIKIENPSDLLELDTAPEHNVNALIVATVGKKYRVLVRPTQQAIDAAPNSGVIYLMSKFILKKCLATAQFRPSEPPAPPLYRDRDRDMDQRPRRDQGHGSHRPQGSNSRYFGSR